MATGENNFHRTHSGKLQKQQNRLCSSMKYNVNFSEGRLIMVTELGFLQMSTFLLEVIAGIILRGFPLFRKLAFILSCLLKGDRLWTIFTDHSSVVFHFYSYYVWSSRSWYIEWVSYWEMLNASGERLI